MFIVISYTNPEPIFRQIMDQLRAAITTSKLKPGEQLPSIREMAGELKVSVITVKRAYSELESEGYLTTRPGLGTFVAVIDQESVRQEKVDDLRRELKQMLNTAEVYGITPDQIQQLLEELIESEESDKKRG